MVSTESGVLTLLSTVFPCHNLSLRQREVLSRVPEEHIVALVRSLYPEMKNNPLAFQALTSFLDIVKDSEFSLLDWVKDINSIYAWLGKRNRTAQFTDVCEYTSCSLRGSRLQLGNDVIWFLEQYGFEQSYQISCPT